MQVQKTGPRVVSARLRREARAEQPDVPADQVEVRGHGHPILRRVATAGLLGTTLLTGTVATLAATHQPILGQAVNTLIQDTGMKSVTSTFYGPVGDPEPSSVYGKVYLLNTAGTETPLAMPNQLSPNETDGHTNIPKSAVANNRVSILVEGMETPESYYQSFVSGDLQSANPSLVNLNQPVVMIHEGTQPQNQTNIARIGDDLATLKGLQADGDVQEAKAYVMSNHDMAARSSYDELRQQLEAGHDILLMAHSGGGAESALALNILAREGFQQQISEHVRVLAMATAATPQDYYSAGVTQNNLFFTAGSGDPIYQLLGSHYLNPDNPISFGYNFVSDFIHAAGSQSTALEHAPAAIVDMNDVHGDQRIADFVNGGKGGVYIYSGATATNAVQQAENQFGNLYG